MASRAQAWIIATVAVLITSLALAQGKPPADTQTTSPTGTAAIRGRITAADGRPLRGAHVTLAGPELGHDDRSANTNSDGRYEIKDLPAGRYTLSVARGGYLTLRYGQRRPLEQPKLLHLVNRQVIERLDFALPKMALIAGRVTDEAGDPIAGVNVFAMRSAFFEGRRRLVHAGESRTKTDDVGQYRLFGLPPGTYFVLATTRETWTVNTRGKSEVMGFAPTYFPGTPAAVDAKRIAIGVGQEIRGIDFSLVPGRTVAVSGTVTRRRAAPKMPVIENVQSSFTWPVL